MNLRGQKNSENVYIYKNFIRKMFFIYAEEYISKRKNFKIRQKIYVQNRGGGGSECVICDEAQYL